MCWSGIVTNRKVSDGNIKCFKVVRSLNERLYGYYHQNTSYNLGITYIQEALILNKIIITKYNVLTTSRDTISIDKGYHSYSFDCNVTIGTMHNILNHDTLLVFSKDGIFLDWFDIKSKIIECTIPKGTIYYENKKGE